MRVTAFETPNDSIANNEAKKKSKGRHLLYNV